MEQYIVRTLHGGNRFIVPVNIEAESFFEAACKRFKLQAESSQAGTTALLVYRDGASPQIFYVRKAGYEVVDPNG